MTEIAAPKKMPIEINQKMESGEENGLGHLRNLKREIKLRAMAQRRMGSRRMK